MCNAHACMHGCKVRIKQTQRCLQAALAEALRQFMHFKVAPGAEAALPNKQYSVNAAAQAPAVSRAPSQGSALPLAQRPPDAPAGGSGAAPSGATSRSATESSEASSDASASLGTPTAAAPEKAAAVAGQEAGATTAPKQAPAPAAARQPAARAAWRGQRSGA